jgi:hypothetical protein
MRTIIAPIALAVAAAALSLSTGACSADIHDNTADVHDNNTNIEDAQVEISTAVDVDEVKAGQVVPCAIKAEDVYLVDPAADPPADRVEIAGHFQIYFDNVNGTPVLITAKESITVTIPSDAQPGSHKFICRVHKHDGTPTSASFELGMTVTSP